MPRLVRMRCRNCGNRFEVEVLTEEEVERARDERRPISAIACPVCHRTDIWDGWD